MAYETRAAGKWCGIACAMLLASALPARGAPAEVNMSSMPAPHYVAVPAGQLRSVLSTGSAAQTPVSVAAFALRETVVTNSEFAAFLDRHPEWQKAAVPEVFADPGYLHALAFDMRHENAAAAVTSVSWFAAQAYCESEAARLPNWYEWEYVAAADARRRDARDDPQWRARILNWYAQPATRTRAAAGGAPNAYGVRDMHGLVWEWVADFNALLVAADSRNQGDPDQLQYCGAGAISLQDRDNYAVLMRIALLSSLNGKDTTDSLGFRCARSTETESK
jgi:sulfatase modifying factor 1